ncbi:MAG: hypothetical protein CK532_04090 [Flavobacteriales bacterium]|nr:MAG: hypothetical protein CK532_04090 [Flavobacteriales bacterium]
MIKRIFYLDNSCVIWILRNLFFLVLNPKKTGARHILLSMRAQKFDISFFGRISAIQENLDSGRFSCLINPHAHMFSRPNLFLAIVFLLQAQSIKAQSFSGLQSSNFAGVHSLFSNPALLASMQYKRHSNLSTFSADIQNNMVSLNTPFSLWQAINGNVPQQYLNSKGRIQWKNTFLQAQSVGVEGWGNLNLEWRGPSYAKRVGNRFVWAVASRTRSNIAIKHISQGTVNYVNYLLNASPMPKDLWVLIAPQPFSFQANAYQELSASMAMTMVDQKKIKMSMGVTGKYLMGLGHVSIISEGLQIEDFNHDSLRIVKSNLQVSYSQGQFMQRFLQGFIVGGLPMVRNIIGSGLGFDFGLSIEGGRGSLVSQVKDNWLGNPGARNYRWRFSAALTDWGNVNYGNQTKSFRMNNSQPQILRIDSSFSAAFAKGSVEGFQYIEDFAKQNMNYTELKSLSRVDLPTQIQLQGDMRLASFFYVAAQLRQSLVSAQKIGFRQPSSLVIVPRIETKWLEFSMPLGLFQDYRMPMVGSYFRLGPIFLGSDNVVSAFLTNKVKGLNLYFGLSTSLGKCKK